jgi:hypothetical protein
MPPLNPWTSKMSGYKAGQNVACKVVRQEPGGYEVRTTRDNLPGFLPTEAKLKDGEEVLAQFVCVSNNRVLLSARLSGSTLSASGKYRAPSTNWQQQLDDPAAAAAAAAASEQEAAFAVWAQHEPVNFKLRRAIDLILPSIGDDKGANLLMKDEDLEWLITDLEGGMRTGCVKAFCEPRKSRSAVLLYRGRAVGCIYGNKTLPEPQPTEPSLQMMLNDLQEPETNLLIYDLPEEVTLAMSALFLGYPVERNDDLDGRSYLDYIGSWLQQKEQTACLAISTSNGATCLAFVFKGRYVGAFYVEDQTFDPNIQFVFDLLNNDRAANVSASILPPELTSASVRFGFSLSMAKKAASGGTNGLGMF